MKIVKFLANAQQAHSALESVWREIKPWLIAEHHLELEVRQARRSSAQNAMLHSLIGEIAKTTDWAGKRREAEVWKRLLTAAWLRARGESVEVLPALDGHGIDVVFRRTSDLTKAECAELLDFVSFWAAEHGVEFMESA